MINNKGYAYAEAESNLTSKEFKVFMSICKYMTEDNLVVDLLEFTMNNSPPTNFMAPYNVVAALDLSEDMKVAASIPFSSATLLEFIAPSMITLMPSS